MEEEEEWKTTEKQAPGVIKRSGRLESPNGKNDKVAGVRPGTPAANGRQDGKIARSAYGVSIDAMARHEKVDVGQGEEIGCSPQGLRAVGDRHHGYGREDCGRNDSSREPGRGQIAPANIKIRWHYTVRARTKTRPAAAEAAAAGRTAAEAAATKLNSSQDSVSMDNNNNNKADPDQMVGDCPAKEPEENLNGNNATGDYRPGPDPEIRLEYGRQQAGLETG